MALSRSAWSLHLEGTYLAGMIPTKDGPRPLYNALQPSSVTIRLTDQLYSLKTEVNLPHEVYRVYKLVQATRDPCTSPCSRFDGFGRMMPE
jgi:hypothetical protein